MNQEDDIEGSKANPTEGVGVYRETPEELLAGLFKEADEDALREARESAIKPSYYTVNGIECVKVAAHFSFLRGNAMKYIWRAGKKNPKTEVEDLQKAIECLRMEVEYLEENR